MAEGIQLLRLKSFRGQVNMAAFRTCKGLFVLVLIVSLLPTQLELLKVINYQHNSEVRVIKFTQFCWNCIILHSPIDEKCRARALLHHRSGRDTVYQFSLSVVLLFSTFQSYFLALRKSQLLYFR